jgi:hypothetical protein
VNSSLLLFAVLTHIIDEFLDPREWLSFCQNVTSNKRALKDSLPTRSSGLVFVNRRTLDRLDLRATTCSGTWLTVSELISSSMRPNANPHSHGGPTGRHTNLGRIAGLFRGVPYNNAIIRF